MHPAVALHHVRTDTLRLGFVIAAGRATLLIGGEENSGRVEVNVVQGDAVLEVEGEFEMVEAYPAGAE